MVKTRTMVIATLTAALAAGCAPDGDATSEDVGTGAQQEMMGDMDGMDGMDGMTGAGGTLDDMGTHMAMMATMHGDSMTAMLPVHRQMMANMIARMNREMADMEMPADASWNATIDSLRQDLVRMPDMNAAELEAMMPGHRARAMRLMEMHRRMMADMGM